LACSSSSRPNHRFTRECRRLAQFKLWQLVVAVILCGILFSMMSVSSPILPFMLAILIVPGLYLRT